MDTKQLDELLAMHGKATAPGTGTDAMWSLCDAAFKHFPSLISQAREAIALRDENERLRAEVAELEARNASQHDLLHRCWKAGSGYFVEAGEYRNGIQPPFEEWIAAALAPTPEVQR